MSIKFLCTGCGHKLRAADGLSGKRIRCTGCGQTMVVPVPEAVPPRERETWAVPVGAHAPAANLPLQSAEVRPTDSFVVGQVRPSAPPTAPRPALRGAVPGSVPAPTKPLEDQGLVLAFRQLAGAALAQIGGACSQIGTHSIHQEVICIRPLAIHTELALILEIGRRQYHSRSQIDEGAEAPPVQGQVLHEPVADHSTHRCV